VRRLLLRAAAGLGVVLTLAAGWGWDLARGSELKGADPKTGKVPAAKPAAEEGECGNHGTSVRFHPTPSAAARQAKKEQKLVFVLHISGDFENPDFT
jgi:hypothetical protein